MGITIAAFDNNPLCGINPGNYVFAGPNPDATFATDDGSSWQGPSLVPANADGSPVVATYWAKVFMNTDPGPLVAGAYAITGTVPLLACGDRLAADPPLAESAVLLEPPVKWIAPGPLVLPALPLDGIVVPLLGFLSGGEGAPSPDTLTTTDNTVLFASLQNGQSGGSMSGIKPGSVRVTATSAGRASPDSNVSVDIDVEVVAPPDVLALQAGRLVRRGHSADSVIPLPPDIGDSLRVFWESEREDAIVIGTQGIWLQDATGAIHTMLAPCGADDVIDGTLTASAPAHASQMRDLALLVHEGRLVHHCEIDLTALTETIDVPVEQCDASRVFGDSLTGQFFAAGDTCAITYVATAAAATNLQSTTFASDGSLLQLAGNEHAALAVIIVGDQVYGFNLFGPLQANDFNFTRHGANTFTPTAIAIDPVNGAPLVAGYGNDNQGIGEEATIFLGFTDHLGQKLRYLDLARLDAVGYQPPTALLFDSATNSFYSSRFGDPFESIAAEMVVYNRNEFNESLLTDAADRPIRAWPDGLAIIDMVMAGPQPTNLSTAAADAGQSVTITGSGFNGGARDQVYVDGIQAVVTASTRDSVTFTMPPALHAFTVALQERLGLPVYVRSSGMLSGSVPMSASGNAIELPVNLPGASITPGFYTFQACDSVCSPGMKMVDGLGSQGWIEVRPPGDNPGIASLNNDSDNDFSLAGFLGPVRVPGPRRIVGYSGTSLYDFFPLTYSEEPDEATTDVRSLDIAQAVTAIAPSPDGRLIAVADGAGIDFRWSGSFAAHPAARVAVASTSSLTMTSKNLVVAATATGGISAVRFSATTPALVTVAADTTNCPSGGRSAVLGVAHDVVAGDVLVLSRYGTTLASEVMSDDGTSVTMRCQSTGEMTGIINGTIKTSTIDRTGLRAVLVDGVAAYLYDTSDMRVPMSQQSVAADIEGVFLSEANGDLLFYNVNAFSPQQLNEP